MKPSRFQVALVLILATLYCYGNCLQNQFVWDDEVLVTNNSFIRNCTYVDTAFTSGLFHNYIVEVASHYRPLQTLTYMLDYRVWGLNPFGYHLTNVLLHLACVLLVAGLVEKLTARRWIALFVAILFAVHPVNTNAVTYISGRADSLAFAFEIVSLLLFIAYRERLTASTGTQPFLYSASILSFIAALFSRESALLYPLIVFAYCLTLGSHGRASLKEAVLSTLPFVLVALAFGFWRNEVLLLQSKPLHPGYTLPLIMRCQFFFRAMATYVGLIFWPAHLQMERQLAWGGLGLHILTAAGVVAVAALAIYANWARRHSPLTLFGLSWFILTLTPLMGLFTLNAAVAEHWLYVPAVGLYLALGASYFYFEGKFSLRSRQMVMAGFAAAILALAVRTTYRNADWATPVSLLSSTEKSAPYSAFVRSNLAREYGNTGRTAEAVRELKVAEQMEPWHWRAKSNLAALYLQNGDLAAAAAKSQECLRLSPDDTASLLLAAQIAEAQGDLSQARSDYIRATATTLDLSPRLQYGAFLVTHHKLKEALDVVDECFGIEPGNAKVFNLLGAILSENKHFDRAEEAFQMARSLDRHSPDADLNLGRLAARRGDDRSAEECYRRALSLEPADPRTHYQLGLALWRQGNLTGAQAELQRAASLAPESNLIREAVRKISTGCHAEAA